jgi:RNA polymerase sigma factor (sigma-70 family)
VTTNHDGWLTQRFEENRRHLSAVAYRMLGSASEAEDAVQEAWLRLRRPGAAEIDNLGGWLTTVVARVCLDMLRSRRSRLEVSLAEQPSLHDVESSNPEEDALIADSVGLAMLVVLDTLSPPERVAFVLHDMFAVPFEEIAPIVGRSPDAARQLASRARRRVARGARSGRRPSGRRSCRGDGLAHSGPRRALGGKDIRRASSSGATDARRWPRRLGVVLRGEAACGVRCRVSAEAIVEISMIADPDRLAELQLAPLD